ncbi:hypothetical protein [Tabrizicola sp.]|uniref:hypothetical protein n=1 Tax=Tabrizicola sp. TaxID=2005166 RepID=UPI002735302F|nr:hypothetical protein [Tabrizicola sp.]MDP3194637.1 hypothetical protein [Tabrizicola sp.]
MTMTHSAIAQIFTHRLEPAEFHEEESSVERGRRAEMEAFSLTRLAGRMLRWRWAPAAMDPQVELQAAVKRLSELSPHLLIDVGIDPATGEVAEDGVALISSRPIRSVDLEREAVALPTPAVRADRLSRLRLQIKVLPAAGETAAASVV